MIPALIEQEFATKAKDTVYVNDVFSSYTYTGNGVTQVLTDGIDRTKGFMTLIKSRNSNASMESFDSLRGVSMRLSTPDAQAQINDAPYGVSAYDNTGMTVSDVTNGGYGVNGNTGTLYGGDYVALTFRNAPKFFSQRLVTHTNGSNTVINFSELGTIGMFVSKPTNIPGDWRVAHRVLTGAGGTSGQSLFLNTMSAAVGASVYIDGANAVIHSSVSSGVYVVYAWAHSTSSDWLVQCGSFTQTSSDQEIDLGGEIQFLLTRPISISSNWILHDVSRGCYMTAERIFFVNSSASEYGVSPSWQCPSAKGFIAKAGGYDPGVVVAYMAIRRPNKPASLIGASRVFCPVARTGTGAAGTVTAPGFPADFLLTFYRAGGASPAIVSRLYGNNKLVETGNANSEQTGSASVLFDVIGGYGFSGSFMNTNGSAQITYALKRAPGFFDEVCFVGSGTARTLAHSLMSVPGMFIVKPRGSGNWYVYHKAQGAGYYGILNSSDIFTASSTAWNNTVPTDAVFSVGVSATNSSGVVYSAYLFGDTPGLCKAFAYIGSISDVYVSLGFTPRLVMIKRTDVAGDWVVFDTARGIVPTGDPVFSLNTITAESNADSIDPITGGFNAVAGGIINASGSATYVGWASA